MQTRDPSDEFSELHVGLMSVSKCLYLSPSRFPSFPISFYLFSFSLLTLYVCLFVCLYVSVCLSVSASVCLSLNVSLTIGGVVGGLKQQNVQPHYFNIAELCVPGVY